MVRVQFTYIPLSLVSNHKVSNNQLICIQYTLSRVKKQCTIDAFLRVCTMEMWKTAAPPMENRYSRPDGKAAGFPTARKHRFPQFRKHDRLRTFPQRLLRRISFPSDPDGKRKRKQKKKWERHPRLKPKAALPLCYGKVFKTASLHPSNQRERPAWEIIRTAPGKAATDDFSANFQPLLPHFFERTDW